MKRIDIIGRKYGRLTVVDCYKVDNKKWICKCDCDCGNKTEVLKYNIMQGKVKSCGCLRTETIIKRSKRYNKYKFEQDYGIGYDCNNNVFYFDKDDFEKIRDISWRVHQDGCVMGYLANNKKYIKMHRYIMDCLNDECVVDHINHNRNDNRKINLRKSTISENMRNIKIKTNNTSGCPGVCWSKLRNKWMARITFDKKKIFLGYFDDISDAIKVRKDAEDKYFGDRSYDNSIMSVNII